MKPEQIPMFLADVMMEILGGIDYFNDNWSAPKADYPAEIDIHLSVEKDDEHHQIWIKVPFRSPLG